MVVPKATKMTSGNWYINLRLGGQSISVTETTEKKCVREAQRIKAEYLTGKRIKLAHKHDAPTLRAAIDQYIAERQNILSPATLRGYRIVQKNRFQDIMDLRIDQIDRSVAQRAVNAATHEYSAKTVCNSWRFLSSVLADLGGETVDVRLPQIVPPDPKFLTTDQIAVFTRAIAGTDIEIPALLALCSLRQSELLGLEWEDVDLDHAVVRVRAAMVPGEDHKFIRKIETKNPSSRRTVPIMPQLVDALRAVSDKTGSVVRLTHSWIYKRLSHICEENSLPHVGLHGLRHSFASLAYHLGIPDKIAMEVGGWADDATMKKIYTHVAEADRLASETKMQNFYASVKNAK